MIERERIISERTRRLPSAKLYLEDVEAIAGVIEGAGLALSIEHDGYRYPRVDDLRRQVGDEPLREVAVIGMAADGSLAVRIAAGGGSVTWSDRDDATLIGAGTRIVELVGKRESGPPVVYLLGAVLVLLAAASAAAAAHSETVASVGGTMIGAGMVLYLGLLERRRNIQVRLIPRREAQTVLTRYRDLWIAVSGAVVGSVVSTVLGLALGYLIFTPGH